MNPTGTHHHHGFDVVAFIERLAQRLERTGTIHPVAAAVAQAARGRGVHLDAPTRTRVESGQVAFAELPDAVAAAFSADELLRLAALSAP